MTNPTFCSYSCFRTKSTKPFGRTTVMKKHFLFAGLFLFAMTFALPNTAMAGDPIWAPTDDGRYVVIDRGRGYVYGSNWMTDRHQRWQDSRASLRHARHVDRACLVLRADWRCPQPRRVQWHNSIRHYGHWRPRRMEYGDRFR